MTICRVDQGKMKTKLTIRNCLPTFQFQCPKLWQGLAITADAGVRHCDACDKDVFFCKSDDETIQHAKAGHCIAREVPDTVELGLVLVGIPISPLVVTPDEQKAQAWFSRENGIDDSIKNLDVSSRCCPSCGFPAPNWQIKCRICGNEFGRAFVSKEE